MQSDAAQVLPTLVAEFAIGHNVIAARAEEHLSTTQQGAAIPAKETALRSTTLGTRIAGWTRLDMRFRNHSRSFQTRILLILPQDVAFDQSRVSNYPFPRKPGIIGRLSGKEYAPAQEIAGR
jgi:hypothetical protein